MSSRKYFLFFLILYSLLNVSLSYEDHDIEGKSLSRQKKALLYPQFTLLQVSVAFIAAISYLPSHRVAVNTGFQANYNLPFALKGFYSPAFWARSDSNGTSFVDSFFYKMIASSDESSAELSDDTTTIIPEITTELIEKKKEKAVKKSKRHVSASEFYYGINESFKMSGYHEDCLLKSICELAKHPLIHDKENLLHEMLYYVLTPSVHQSFDEMSEGDLKELFEEAENLGKSDGDCESKYEECKQSPLHSISKFIPIENDL